MFYVLGAHRWMLRGACRQADPELFFPVTAKEPAERQIEAAKAVCAPCAVRASCLSYALEAKAGADLDLAIQRLGCDGGSYQQMCCSGPGS